MFGFLSKNRRPSKDAKRSRKPPANRAAAASRQSPQSDAFYDIIKKISDLQDQLSRHDSRIYGRLEEHDNLQTQYNESMKNAAIEIMNRLYRQPQPVREEVFRIIKSDENILAIIGDGKMGAGEVAQKMGLSREHVSRRVSELTKNGLLLRIQEGKRVFYAKPDNSDVM